jgi:hypothetical protein
MLPCNTMPFTAAIGHCVIVVAPLCRFTDVKTMLIQQHKQLATRLKQQVRQAVIVLQLVRTHCRRDTNCSASNALILHLPLKKLLCVLTLTSLCSTQIHFTPPDLLLLLLVMYAYGCVCLQPAEPQLHRLDVNYRSHAGILDVASALVSVIQDFFPNTVDRCVAHVQAPCHSPLADSAAAVHSTLMWLVPWLASIRTSSQAQ